MSKKLQGWQKRYITLWWDKKSYSEISRTIGIDRGTITRYLKKQGIETGELNRVAKTKLLLTGKTTSTPEIDAVIRTDYLTVPIKRLANMVGKSGTFVTKRLQQLGLVIPREIIEQRKQESRIKTGDAPPNKGKKWADYMTEEGKRGALKTCFKKGNLPHNAKDRDGVISIRPDKNGRLYKFIRVGLGKWIPYQVYRWEKYRGPVPQGRFLVFKDGDSLNCKLGNLELVDRAENMRRNSIHNYPPEIKTALRRIKKLKTTIQSYEEQH